MDLYNSLCSVTYIHPKNKHDFGELTFQEVLSGDQTVVVLAEAWCSIQQEVGAFILINAEENLRVFKVPWVEHGLRSVGQKLAIHNRHKWKSEQSGPWQNLHGLQTHMGLWNNATLNTKKCYFLLQNQATPFVWLLHTGTGAATIRQHDVVDYKDLATGRFKKMWKHVTANKVKCRLCKAELSFQFAVGRDNRVIFTGGQMRYWSPEQVVCPQETEIRVIEIIMD